MDRKEVAISNAEMAEIYAFLRGDISRRQLTLRINRTRTNTYYYIGRAVEHWIKTGVLRFKRVKDMSDLGGTTTEDAE